MIEVEVCGLTKEVCFIEGTLSTDQYSYRNLITFLLKSIRVHLHLTLWFTHVIF